jgi:hypothetical protein
MSCFGRQSLLSPSEDGDSSDTWAFAWLYDHISIVSNPKSQPPLSLRHRIHLRHSTADMCTSWPSNMT